MASAKRIGENRSVKQTVLFSYRWFKTPALSPASALFTLSYAMLGAGFFGDESLPRLFITLTYEAQAGLQYLPRFFLSATKVWRQLGF
jgi:hypothetical protein